MTLEEYIEEKRERVANMTLAQARDLIAKALSHSDMEIEFDKAVWMLLSCADEKINNGWIPVTERLPELDVNINVYEKKNPIMISKPVYISYRLDGHDYICPIPCILHSNGHWYNDVDSLKDWVQLDDYDGGADLPISLDVTAWMPLPQPYKADMRR